MLPDETLPMYMALSARLPWWDPSTRYWAETLLWVRPQVGSGLQAMHLCVNHLPDNLKRPFFHCIMCSFRLSASTVCPWGSVPMQEYLRKLLAHHQCCVFKLNGCIGDKFSCVPTDSPQQEWQVYLLPLHVSEYFEDTFNQETTLFKKPAPVLGMVHMWVEIRVSCIGTTWGPKAGSNNASIGEISVRMERERKWVSGETLFYKCRRKKKNTSCAGYLHPGIWKSPDPLARIVHTFYNLRFYIR